MWDFGDSATCRTKSLKSHKTKTLPKTKTPWNPAKAGRLEPTHGGYRNGITYQKSEIIYDGSVYFTKRNADYTTYQKAIEHDSPEICGNAIICLINIVSYLLKQQLKTLETAFINEGGLRERMTKARIGKRNGVGSAEDLIGFDTVRSGDLFRKH